MNTYFRGKVKYNQVRDDALDWVQGDLVHELSTGRTFILDLAWFNDTTTLVDVLIEVLPETVGKL